MEFISDAIKFTTVVVFLTTDSSVEGKDIP